MASISIEGQVAITVIDGVVYRQGSDDVVPLEEVQGFRDRWADRVTQATDEIARLQARSKKLQAELDLWDLVLAEATV